MPPLPRKDIFDPKEVGIYHCNSRCVRRTFLCGYDPESGQSFDHRKEWLEQDTARLASIFAIDVLDHCVMDNHIHHVLRNRPDIADKWSDEEVGRRWWMLYPKRREADGSPSEIRESELAQLISDPEQVQEYRERLCHLSWFMKALKEPVAKRANAEDDVTGHFWAERFKSTRLLDEAAVLACSIYVNLNMIRAGTADTPEDSRYTSVWHRIQALLQANDTPWPAGAKAAPRSGESAEGENDRKTDDEARTTGNDHSSSRPDAWLAPVPEEGEPDNQTSPAYRASDRGFLPMSVEQYLELLDWTGRQIREGAGRIPDHLAPILERLGIQVDYWTATIQSLHGWFPRAIGSGSAVAAAAQAADRRWFRGVRRCRQAFTG